MRGTPTGRRQQAAPVILVMCNSHVPEDGIPLHVANDRVVTAIGERGALAVLLPNGRIGEEGCRDLLSRVDGLLLTGSVTMVDPHLYGAPRDPWMRLNTSRDCAAIDAINAAMACNVPIFGICRGLHELNVAFGGTLRELPAGSELASAHQAPHAQSQAEKYRESHSVQCSDGGLLWSLANGLGFDPANIPVNSLHRQAIDHLADGLCVEALAPDGVIEAIRLADASDPHLVAVQWHAEWDPPGTIGHALLDSFVGACRQRMETRSASVATAVSES